MEKQQPLDPNDVDTPELIPIEQYDVNQARTATYISWVLTKAYGKNIPKDFQQPFYCTNNGEEHLKPSVIKALISSEIHCKACAQLFRDPNTQWKGHLDVMQTLSRKGIYVTDPHESAVTEALLLQKTPFKLSCHLSLIEALMTAWTNELVTIERIVQAVRKFSSFNASSELPFDTEDALLFWINKVCGTVRHRIGKGEVVLPSANDVMVPVMDDLLKDLSDGCCLCVIISFYCPTTLRLQDIALNDPVGIGDSLFNLGFSQLFCQRYLPEKCDHLTINDLFHSPADLKPSFIVLLAELFSWLEVRKISVSTNVKKPSPTRTMADINERPPTAKNLTSPSATLPPMPISNATKRSFQHGASPAPGELVSSSSGSASVPLTRQPLLPKRSQHGSMDSQAGEQNVIGQSVRAWEEDPKEAKRIGQLSSTQSQLTNITPLNYSTDSSRTLLGNVSMDSEMSLNFTESSIDISELEDTPRQTPVGPICKPKTGFSAPGSQTAYTNNARITESGQPDFLELKSVTPVVSSRTATPQNTGNPHSGNPGGNPHVGNPHGGTSQNAQVGKSSQPTEPLIPANLRTAKEKLNNNHTKQVESGEILEKRSPTSPNKPPKTLNFAPVINSIEMGGNDSDGSTPDEDYQTPSMESVPLPGEKQLNGIPASSTATTQSSIPEGATMQPSRPPFEAFYVNTDSSLVGTIPLGQMTRDDLTRTPVTESFTLHDHPHTVDSARAAGIPIVDLSTGQSLSELSSSESSDPELQKLRADHRSREIQGSSKILADQRPLSSTAKTMPQKSETREVPKTSFAQMKQEKTNGEPSTVTYNSSKQADSGFSLKSQFQKGRPAVKVQKKTTFAALPNQTTWQENAKSNTHQKDSNLTTAEDDASPTNSELIDIKMRLEERRRQIENEKRRMEMQWTNQRQRLGKQAFIQVINRGKSESDLRLVKESPSPTLKAKQTPVDARLSKLINSQCDGGKERSHDRSHDLSKGSSAPASREQSVEREYHIEPAPVKPEPPESYSPRESLVRSVDSAKDMLSERNIEPLEVNVEPVTISSQQQSYQQPSKTKPRPKSYHAPDQRQQPSKTVTTSPAATRAQSTTPYQSQSLTSSTDNPNVGNYNTSLDRLNCSLSELQGEIMRLSLQQDQIKSLVVHDKEPSKSPTPPRQVTPPPEPSQQSKYYHHTAGEPDVTSSRTDRALASPNPPQAAQQSAGTRVAPSTYQSHQSAHAPYPGQPQQHYAAVPSYPYQPYQPTNMYTVPPQYPGMPQSQFHAAPVYQPQMYPQSVPGYPGMPQNHWPTGTSPMTHPIQPSAQSPYNNNTFHSPLQPQFSQTYTMSSGHHQGSLPMTSTAGMSPDHQYKSPGDYASTRVMSHTATPQTPPYSQSLGSPAGFRSPRTHTPMQAMSPSMTQSAGRDELSSQDVDVANDDQTNGEPQSEGFFIGFDENSSPHRPKPNFIRDRRKGDLKHSSPDKQSQGHQAASPPPVHCTAPPEFIDISPVGFVIGQDEADVSSSNTENSEMEKKRQKFMEQQMKRREEQERKRLKIEQEMAKKREQQEAIRDEQEQKKADDKKRREAIFQEYLKRKEQDSADEEPKLAPPPVQKRAHSKGRTKPSRPKSQPPPGGMEDVAPPLSNTSGSQEDVRRSPSQEIGGKQTGHVMAFPGPNGNGNLDPQDANYQQLAFGGLTHRRPPTPERPTRLFLDNGSDTGSGPPPADYTGPKLFKKPSQKSNRSIIMNAISHCCLAGVVNTGVKEKVLDAVTKSGAKHFVIMFRDGGQQFKAIYTYDPEKEEVIKIHGVGPKQLTDDMMERFYKYNSGAKSFTEVTSTKHLTATIDALVIHNHLWQKKPPPKGRLPNQY